MFRSSKDATTKAAASRSLRIVFNLSCLRPRHRLACAVTDVQDKNESAILVIFDDFVKYPMNDTARSELIRTNPNSVWEQVVFSCQRVSPNVVRFANRLHKQHC